MNSTSKKTRGVSKKKNPVSLTFRKATLGEAREIHSLINAFAKRNSMLPRSLNEIYELIRDFYLCVRRNKVIAVCSLHIVWEDLAEIRSVAVLKKYQNQGIGKTLVLRCLKEAWTLGVKSVFALTFSPGYFRELGFEDIDKNDLPHKIWGDCLKCPKFPDCNEVAVVKRLGN